jgi:hypothetical protein
MSQRQRKARAKQRRHAPITAARPRAIAIGGAALGATLAMGGVAQASTFEVANTNPDGTGSLAEAIGLANDNPGFDTITFASVVTGEITLENNLPEINDDVDIQGPGAAILAVSGDNSHRVFYVGDSTDDGGTTISGLTIKNGSWEYGAGVTATGDRFGNGFDLTLDGVSIQDNYSAAGAGVAAKYGSLAIKNSTISGNKSFVGGGVLNAEAATIVDQSTLKDNQAYLGGGLFAEYGFTGVTSSTISGNQAPVGAGALVTRSDNEFANSTIADNTAAPITLPEATRRLARTTPIPVPIPYEFADYGYGGGLVSLDAYSRLDSTTVAHNTATYAAGVWSQPHGLETVSLHRPGLAKAAQALQQLHRQATAQRKVSGDAKPSWHVSRVGVNSSDVSFEGKYDLTLDNSLLAGNTATSTGYYGGADDLDAFGPPVDAAFTVVQSPQILDAGIEDLVDAGGSNQVGIDLNLGNLGNHGGPTQTILPALGSAAVDHGSDPFSDGSPFVKHTAQADAVRKLVTDVVEAPASLDQRGFARPIGAPAWIVDDGEDGNFADGTDIGAVELQPGEKVPGNPDVSVIVPVITSVAPATGNEGSTVIITGDRFNGATRVYFGHTPATSFSVDGFRQITAIAPAGTGAVDVHVTTSEGTSSSGAADKFTYLETAGALSTAPQVTPPKLQGLLAKLKSVLLSIHNDQLAFIDQFGEPGSAVYGLDLQFNTGNASAVKTIHLASHRVTVNHAGAVRVRIHLSKHARTIMARHPGAKLVLRSRFVSKATGQWALSRRTLRHPRHRHHG